MASETRPTKQGVDGDGVRVTHTPGVRAGVWLLLAAAVLVALALVLLLRPLFEGERRAQVAAAPTPPPRPLPAAAAAKLPAAGARLEPIRAAEESAPEPAAGADQARAERLQAYAAAAATAAAEDASTRDSDEPRGIELFPPPGTNPPKSGILVPDDFELPPGYVRHYQSTDDGQQLPAILMFHPDFQLVDENGEPLPMPEDRVVPADLAPPGLAIQILEVPQSEVPMVEIPSDHEQDDNP
jgi:hypothetical protein